MTIRHTLTEKERKLLLRLIELHDVAFFTVSESEVLRDIAKRLKPPKRLKEIKHESK